MIDITSNVVINGNLTVEGNITYIDSSVIQITDPVIQLGEENTGINDLLDRGVSFIWTQGGIDKKGFFGF